jgi:hypothetical protein
MERSIANHLQSRLRSSLRDAEREIDKVIDEEVETVIADIYSGALKFATTVYDAFQEILDVGAQDQEKNDAFREYLRDCIAGYTAWLRENVSVNTDKKTRKEILAEIARGKKYYSEP